MIGNDMEVIKRTGNREKVFFDKISNRVKKIGVEQDVNNINYTENKNKILINNLKLEDNKILKVDNFKLNYIQD